MAKKKNTAVDISGQLLQAIADSELTINAIAKGAGIARPMLHHFAHGTRDVRLATAAKLAAFLGLELRPVRR